MQLRLKWKGLPPLRSTISIELIMTESVTSLSVLKKRNLLFIERKKNADCVGITEIRKRKTKNLVECN